MEIPSLEQEWPTERVNQEEMIGVGMALPSCGVWREMRAPKMRWNRGPSKKKRGLRVVGWLWFGADQWDLGPRPRLSRLVGAAHQALDLENLGSRQSPGWKV